MTAGGAHVVLVGLPGAGKSTVGPRLAALLGRPFVDFDAELERRAGLTVAEQFATMGEPAFREAESALSRELAETPAAVLAPGGGWIANAAAREALSGSRLLYLRVRPAVAVARLAPILSTRPLVAGARDPLVALGELLARRGALYEQAHGVIDAEPDDPDGIAAAAAALAQTWDVTAASRIPAHV